MNGKKNLKNPVKSFEGDFWNSHHGFIIFPVLNGLTVGTAVVGVGDWWDRARLQECAFLATDCPVQQEHSNHCKDSFCSSRAHVSSPSSCVLPPDSLSQLFLMTSEFKTCSYIHVLSWIAAALSRGAVPLGEILFSMNCRVWVWGFSSLNIVQCSKAWN